MWERKGEGEGMGKGKGEEEWGGNDLRGIGMFPGRV